MNLKKSIPRLQEKSLDQFEYELNNILREKGKKEQWLTLFAHCSQKFTIAFTENDSLVILDTDNKLKMTFNEDLQAKVSEYD